MAREISRGDQVAFAELVERAHDVQFVDQFPEKGSFIKLARGGREYWYHRKLEPQVDGESKLKSRYVGPADDPEVTKRVESAQRLNTEYAARRRLASQLRRSGLPVPFKMDGDIIEALAKGGLFRLRATLIGSHAFQTYSGVLGVKMGEALYRTDDLDIAQFHSISVLLDDAMPDIGSILTAVDETFQPIIDPMDPSLAAGYANSAGVKVEALTTNRRDAAHGDRLAKMPALGGIGAQPLPFLDFLIRDPIRSVLLHDAGVGVVVPAPERFAVHKLIVATRRKFAHRSKVSKDLQQAAALISAMSDAKQGFELGNSWMEAWERGPKWRKHLAIGSLRLPDEQFAQLESAVVEAATLSRKDKNSFGLGKGRDGLVALWQRALPKSDSDVDEDEDTQSSGYGR